MKAELVRFGEIEIEGQRYDGDVVIERGRVRPRRKKPSKPFRDRFGHTPLSVEEAIPWHDRRLIVGTGAEGLLPIMDEVHAEAKRRGIELVALPTASACRLISRLEAAEVDAILHVTC